MTSPFSPGRHAIAFRAVRRPTALLALLGLCIVAGCSEDAGIQHYRQPHEPKIEAPHANPGMDAPAGEQKRLLVAYLPTEDKSFTFFKIEGPPEAVEQVKADFLQFLEKSADLSKPYDTWTALPKGWRFEPAPPGGMRLATFAIDSPRLQVAITKFGGTELANVNRWRGQVGLPDVTEADLPKVTQDQKIGDKVGKLVDFKPAQAAKPGIPTWIVPAGWEKAPPVEFSIATFTINANDPESKVTVGPFMGFNLPDNLNRWRMQVGLAPVDDPKEMAKDVTELAVDGADGIRVDYQGTNPQTNKKKRLIVVIVRQDKTVWVIKCMGSPETVADQLTSFDAFVKSIKFNAAAGDK
jgi:hypothetical protein